MSVSFDTFPDLEAIVASALRDAGVCGGRVYSSVPRTPTWPLATVKRLGGIPADRRALDAGRIQVDVWGNNKSEARDAAELARRSLHEAEGTTFTEFQGFVTGVEDELGLTFLPDPDSGRDRYVFACRVLAHSAPAEE